MPNIKETVEVARKILPIIYVLDVSGSMVGDKIAAVNEAMNETIEVLKDISAHNSDAEIKVGVLKFSTSAEWVTNGLVFMEDFFWNDLEVGGTTEVATALEALDNKLSRSEFLVSDVGFCVPVIIFMSDGEPTDSGIWEEKLKWINNNNKWFEKATKIAIAIGDDADKNCLTKLVKDREAVITANDLVTLKALIKVISVKSSFVNGSTRTRYDNGNATDIIKQAKNILDYSDETQTIADIDVLLNSGEQKFKDDFKNSSFDDDGDWVVDNDDE